VSSAKVRTVRHSQGFVIALCIGVIACGDTGRKALPHTARESSFPPGRSRSVQRTKSEVRFVDSKSDTVRFTEDLRIGSSEIPFEFGQVNIVVPTADGGIVVLDSKSPKSGALLFRFDSSGQFVRSIGHLGAGPGEYSMQAIPSRLADGTLLVSDPGNARFTRFNLEDKLDNSWPAPMKIGGTGVTPATDSGWYAEVDDYSGGTAHPPLRSFVHYSRNGRITGTIPAPREYLDGPNGGDLAPDSRVAILPDGSLVTSRTNSFEVTVYRSSGQKHFDRQATHVAFLADEAAALTAMIPVKTPGLPAPNQPKATFRRMRADLDGRIILSMEGPGYVDSAAINPNNPRSTGWRSAFWLDLVDPVRGYLGRLLLPKGSTYGAVAISGASVWLKVVDADGTNSIVRVAPARVLW
jgi:hypothetical protein